MSITILSLPHILLHPPNLWKHCGGVPPHVIHHNVYKVSMYSIIHETFMTFNSPCCCARSLVSVKTLSSWYKDKCVGVCSCSPARHIYFFFFSVIRSLPPYSNHRSPSLSLSDRLSSVTASAGIPHRRAAKQGTLADTALRVCVSELILCVCVITSCVSFCAFVMFVISCVDMEVCSPAHECVSHISRLRI